MRATERRLGEVLIEDYRWPSDLVRKALIQQAEAVPGPSRRLGELLAQLDPSRIADIEGALLVQARERRPSPTLLAEEMAALGRNAEYERMDIARRIRWYAMLLIGLVLYTWYPLSLLLGLESNRLSAPAGSGATRWTLPVRFYGAMGIALVLFCFFAGDYLVKSFSAFLKLRVRLLKARRGLRAEALELRLLPATTMPTRDPNSSFDSAERPDPDYSRFHTWLPLFYTAFSLLKLGLLAVFVCLLWSGDVHPDRYDAYRALWTVCVLGVAWVFLTGSMCIRYKRTLLEAELLSPTRPFPKITTHVLRSRAEASHWRGGYFAWGLVHVCLLAGFWIAAAGDRPWYLLGAVVSLLLGLGLRVRDAMWRCRVLRELAGLAPTADPRA